MSKPFGVLLLAHIKAEPQRPKATAVRFVGLKGVSEGYIPYQEADGLAIGKGACPAPDIQA